MPTVANITENYLDDTRGTSIDSNSVLNNGRHTRYANKHTSKYYCQIDGRALNRPSSTSISFRFLSRNFSLVEQVHIRFFIV